MDETTTVNIDSLQLDGLENLDYSSIDTTSMDTNFMMTPGMEEAFWTASVIINILSILLYFWTAFWLYLINKKLGEKYAWLSFVPIIQFYNYFSASQKSFLHYFVFPILALIVWIILSVFTFWISIIAAYIYFIVMWVKLLHAISIRTWNGAWTTLWFVFVSFIMFPIVWLKMNDKSENNSEEKEITENKKEKNTSIEL